TRVTLVAWLVRVIVTPGTGRPLVSVTIPLSSPEGVCAPAGARETINRRNMTAKDLNGNTSRIGVAGGNSEAGRGAPGRTGAFPSRGSSPPGRADVRFCLSAASSPKKRAPGALAADSPQ